MCVTLSCAWLFALSYMLAIVHSEYHELNKDVKKCKYTRQAPVKLNFCYLSKSTQSDCRDIIVFNVHVKKM